MRYIIKSIGYNVSFKELEMTLCEFEGKHEFRQPHFERCWNVLEFSSEYDALVALRKLYPDKFLSVLEDTGKVLATYGPETSMTSIKIKRVLE